MKKFYSILIVTIMMLIPMGMMGQTTVTQTSFSNTSGNVNNDTKVSYAAYKGGGTSAAAVNSNAIRLYQNSNGQTGGYVVIGVATGYQITSATIQSTMATTTGYKLTDTDPGDTTPAKNTFNVSNYSLSANTDYTVSNISTQYITFACFGTSSSSRLYLSKISVTYESTGGQTNTYTVTYHANVTGVEDIEVEYNEGDDVTVAANTFSNPGYAFTKWNTLANGTGTDYDPEDVIEDIDDDIDLYAQWEMSTSTTGMIMFGSSTGHVKINAASVTGDDDINNEWTITTVGTTSFTQSSTYSQVGSSNSPATSITFTTTLPEEVNVTAMEVKFGGFSGTAGTITMKVGSQTIGTGSLNAGNDVVVNSSSTATGDVLTVTVTNIAKGVKCYYISYTYEEATPDPAVATTTTINVPSGFNTDIHNGTNAGTLSATVAAEGTAISGATVTWESSNTGIATIAANGAVTLVAAGTTTITASYAGVEDQYRPSSDTYELTVIDSYAPGTQNNPYTVAQARAAIDAGTGTQGVYVTGIVCTASPQLYSNKYLSYYISADGETTSDQLEAYNGLGLNGANFTSVNDVEVGATVVIYGNLTKYSNTYELAANNYLVSYTAPVHAVEAPTFSPVAGTFTTAQTVTISSATTGASIYYTTDGTEPTNASTEYTSALSISTTTTIKAIAYNGTNYSNVTTATYHFCSAEDPYTVTEALAFNEYPANNIYVSGIVSTAPTSLSSGTLTYYISADGTTTNELEVYKGKDLENANFTAVDDIQVGDIVTVYGNVVIYGTTNPIKEFAQGNYLVSFERPTAPAQEYTLTVGNLSHVNLFIFGGDESQTIISTEDGETTAQVYDGTEVLVSIDVEEGYVFQSLTVTDANGDPVEVEVLTANDLYSFDMPASNVTITASAIAAPAATTYTLATSIESGKQYIIVGQDNGVYYAMGSNRGNNRNGVEVTIDGTTASATIDNNFVHEFTITSLGTENHYSIMDATTNGGYLYAAGSGSGNNYLKTESTLDENGNGDWEITINSGTFSVVASGTSTNKYMRFNNAQDLFACYGSASSQHPVYLYVKNETPTYTLDITPYNPDSQQTDGWNLIASPVSSVTPSTSNGFLTNTYDLYYFDQTGGTNEKEWKNYRANSFNLESGKGYLYANSGDGNNNKVTLTFSGTLYTGDGEFDLTYADETSVAHATMQGWNLVGNPYTTKATVNKDYYVMNSTGTGLEPNALSANGEIEPMQGIFVLATGTGQKVKFTQVTSKSAGNSAVELNLSQNRGGVIDRAIVRFGNSNTLPKFQLFENSTKLYIAQDGKDYAIVGAEAQGEMPVSFKASENGSYTISINTNEVEMNYLHLIDNLTGADVDLMATPSYTFNARTDDYASRFRLVFSTGNADSNSFAFVSNGKIVLTEQGNAQVYDITGRLVNSYNNVNSISTEGMTAGVYVIRLTNGSETMTQKIVVK